MRQDSSICIKAFSGLSPLNNVHPVNTQDQSSTFTQGEILESKQNEIDLRQALIDMEDDPVSFAQYEVRLDSRLASKE